MTKERDLADASGAPPVPIKVARKPVLKRVWQGFVVLAIRSLAAVARILPLSIMLPVGSALGTLGYALSKRYRSVAERNLKIAYGEEMSAVERRRLTRAVFRNFGKAVIEFPYVCALSPQALLKITLLEDEDRARVDRALAQGRGVVAFSAHLGNFELMARRFVVDGYRFMVVVRNDPNATFTKTVNEIRSTGGYDVIGRGDAARPILKHLKNGGIVGILSDQRSGDLAAPFFGRPSGTVAGPAVLALKTGAPLLPIFCIRLPDDTHKLIVMDPINAESTGDYNADILRVMTQVNTIMEEVIRRYPDQWLWLHDRWKIRPGENVIARQETKGQVPSSAC